MPDRFESEPYAMPVEDQDDWEDCDEDGEDRDDWEDGDTSDADQDTTDDDCTCHMSGDQADASECRAHGNTGH